MDGPEDQVTTMWGAFFRQQGENYSDAYGLGQATGGSASEEAAILHGPMRPTTQSEEDVLLREEPPDHDLN